MYMGVSSPHSPDTLALELEVRVSHLWWLISREARNDLSRTAAATLARLREDGPQRVGALATAESVTQPTITCVVQRLEREGLVAREADPQDARAVRISITDAGLQALDARSLARATVLDGRLERLDAEQRRSLVAALGALDELLGDAPATTPAATTAPAPAAAAPAGSAPAATATAATARAATATTAPAPATTAPATTTPSPSPSPTTTGPTR
jgi:DNA-binding MarR family transcriptional regulator